MSEFYPNLFEAEETSDLETVKDEAAENDTKELTQSQIGGILAKYVCASPTSNIILDPNTFEIISVNKKSRQTPVTNWEEVRLFPVGKKATAHRDKFIKFLQSGLDDIKADVDVEQVIKDADKNFANRNKKTFKPIPLPNFPEGFTLGQFWDYQEDLNEDQIISQIEGHETKKSGKSSIKDEALLDELSVPEELSNFFAEHGKTEEFEKFLKNTSESKGASIIGEMSALYELMNEVVTGNIKRKTYKVKKGVISLELNSKNDIETWKSDMIEYIGRYTNDNISDVNNGVYLDKIKKTGSFLGILMSIEPSGMGRGEVLIAYILDGAQFAGGGESYDITTVSSGEVTYELKDYSDSGGSIRLGAHGALTRFQWWKEMEQTIVVARKIYNDLGPEKLKEVLKKDSGTNQFFKIWELIASKKPYQNNRIVGSAIDAGEINTSKIATLKVFYALVHEFMKKTSGSDKEEYTYITISGDNVPSKTIPITPIELAKLDKTKTFEANKNGVVREDLLKFKDFADIKYVNSPPALQTDMDSIGKEYSESSDVDYFMVFLPKRIAIDRLDEYVFDTISQKAVKIKHVSELSAGKKELPAEKAFNKWQGQDKKSFYDIYQSTISGLTEGQKTDYYPQLF